VSDEEWAVASRAARTATWGAVFYLITTDILGPYSVPCVKSLAKERNRTNTFLDGQCRKWAMDQVLCCIQFLVPLRDSKVPLLFRYYHR
jgi:hypothetical protein